jgi:hypothetical protein
VNGATKAFVITASIFAFFVWFLWGAVRERSPVAAWGSLYALSALCSAALAWASGWTWQHVILAAGAVPSLLGLGAARQWIVWDSWRKK